MVDLNLTKHLKHALALIDVRLTDYVIVTAVSTTSLAERGGCKAPKHARPQAQGHSVAPPRRHHSITASGFPLFLRCGVGIFIS